MNNPKPVFDYFRNMLISGFLVFYGIYLFNRDSWLVHDYVGPFIAIGGLALYIFNGYWGWVNITAYFKLGERLTLKILIAISYVILLLALLDAVVHFHHLSFV
jgi:hypothetical protein